MSGKKLGHIVYVSREFWPSFLAGGIASYMKEIAEILALHGIRVTIICASDITSQHNTVVENGVKVIRLAGGDFYIPQLEKNPFWIKKLRFIYRFFSYRIQVKKVVQSLEDVDLIEVAEYGAEALFLQRLNIPVVIRLHTPYLLDRKTADVKRFSLNNLHYYWIGLLEIFILKRAQHITSCSESLKRWMSEKKNIPLQKITTIFNPLDLTNWPPPDDINPSKKKEFSVFFSGRVQSEKGVEELIYAAKSLREKGINVTLYLAGREGKISPVLRKEMKQGNWDWCTFLGLVPRATQQAYFSKSTLSCFPSWWENLPYVCLEAMASGGIVLASSRGGMSEIIRDGENGFLCPPFSVALLAQKMETAFSMSENERAMMAQKAISTIQTRFSNKVIALQMIDYYSTIL